MSTVSGVNGPGDVNVSIDGVLGRLADAADKARTLRAEWRHAVDERNRLVFEAVDIWHVSHRRVARALGLDPSSVEKILAGGLPEAPDTPTTTAVDDAGAA